jgi:hypothetical protein
MMIFYIEIASIVVFSWVDSTLPKSSRITRRSSSLAIPVMNDESHFGLIETDHDDAAVPVCLLGSQAEAFAQIDDRYGSTLPRRLVTPTTKLRVWGSCVIGWILMMLSTLLDFLESLDRGMAVTSGG